MQSTEPVIHMEMNGIQYYAKGIKLNVKKLERYIRFTLSNYKNSSVTIYRTN